MWGAELEKEWDKTHIEPINYVDMHFSFANKEAAYFYKYKKWPSIIVPSQTSVSSSIFIANPGLGEGMA